jgi:hypothetical protein
MPSRSRASDETTESDPGAAKGDVAAQVEEETAQGFRGTKVDPEPNEAYALTSGPDSPGGFGDDRTRATQHGPPTGDEAG